MNAENAEAGGKGCGKSFGRAGSEEKENAVKRLNSTTREKENLEETRRTARQFKIK